MFEPESNTGNFTKMPTKIEQIEGDNDDDNCDDDSVDGE